MRPLAEGPPCPVQNEDFLVNSAHELPVRVEITGKPTLIMNEERGEVVKDHDPMLVETLTERETQILQLVAEEGLENSDLAERLRISMATVKTHVVHILSKLYVDSRILAAILYLVYEQRKAVASDVEGNVAVGGGRVLRLV